jgi:hypothetical protein
MEILGPDGTKIQRSDEDIKAADALMKAKVLQQAQRHGAEKPQFRGMVRGPDGGMEPAFGDWQDGMSETAINLVIQLAGTSEDPKVHAAQWVNAPKVEAVPKPTFTNKQDEIIQKMNGPAKNISKEIFGF